VGSPHPGLPGRGLGVEVKRSADVGHHGPGEDPSTSITAPSTSMDPGMGTLVSRWPGIRRSARRSSSTARIRAPGACGGIGLEGGDLLNWNHDPRSLAQIEHLVASPAAIGRGPGCPNRWIYTRVLLLGWTLADQQGQRGSGSLLWSTGRVQPNRSYASGPRIPVSSARSPTAPLPAGRAAPADPCSL